MRTTDEASSRAASIDDDADLLPVWLILWVGSVARVAFGLADQETFGAEATLALFCVVLVPWVVVLPRLRRRVGKGARGGSGEP